MASGNSEETRKVLFHHWQAFGADDVEAAMADYADDAVLISPEGTLNSLTQIGSLFAKIFSTTNQASF